MLKLLAEVIKLQHQSIWNIYQILFVCLWFAVIVMALVFQQSEQSLYELSNVLSSSRYGVPGFIFLGIFAVVLLLPGVIFTLAAGYIFGLIYGVAYVVIATTIGATMSFHLGRRFLKLPQLKRLNRRYPLLAGLNNSLKRRGGTVVLLTRLIPLFPFKASNYYFGAAGYPAMGFTWGTFFGVIPISTFNVYIGTVAAQFGVDSPQFVDTNISWQGYLLIGIALLLLLLIIAYYAHNALSELRESELNSRQQEKDNGVNT